MPNGKYLPGTADWALSTPVDGRTGVLTCIMIDMRRVKFIDFRVIAVMPSTLRDLDRGLGVTGEV